ncbi:MAG: anti-sigma factor [Saprospiraceae bacterium]|nr:anti-sigma factor [Saprospiraceae bacterium]
MDILSYISSGILELYVLDQLSPEEKREVELMLEKYPEIKKEVDEISIALEKYGQLSRIKAPGSVEENLFKTLPKKVLTDTQINKSSSSDTLHRNYKLFTILLGILSVFGFGLYYFKFEENKNNILQFEEQKRICDSISGEWQQQYVLLNQINDKNNKIINLQPTPAFEDIVVYLHHNDSGRKNFLQLVNLPDINQDQAFQLWSLKEGEAPKPLDVFVDKNTIIPVLFVDKTSTYAITIEPKGGSKSPSLDKLIGTLSII